MLFARLTYSSENLGDDLQTLATMPFLGDKTVPFDRDELRHQESDQRYLLVMNGWWAGHPEKAFPPADCFVPVFIGFHIAESHSNYFTTPQCIAYFKKYEPIGCRDLFTKDLLETEGVKCFFSGCLSTTFDLAYPSDEEKRIYLVDAERVEHLIPNSLKENALRLTHRFCGGTIEREVAVQDLMGHYNRKPPLVITTRLHAALTCSALGIPVVFFFHPDDARASTALQIGLKMYQPSFKVSDAFKRFLIKTNTVRLWRQYEKFRIWMYYRFFEKIDWQPAPLNLEEHKRKLRNQTMEKITEIISAFS